MRSIILLQPYAYKISYVCSGGDLAPSLGGDGEIFRRPRFLNDVLFGEKFSFSRPKFLMTFF